MTSELGLMAQVSNPRGLAEAEAAQGPLGYRVSSRSAGIAQ